jgi:ADP-heptose:LPS heptosyltransferase
VAGSLSRTQFRTQSKYLLACASECAAPALGLLRRGLASASPTPPRQWKDLVLVGADHIGDVLYRTAGLQALKDGLPGTRLHFISSAPACELVETHPALESVIRAPGSLGGRSLGERVRLLRERPADAVLCYDSGNYWKDQLAVALARGANCAGYVSKGFSAFVTAPLPFVFPRPFSETFRGAVEALAQRPGGDLRPIVHLTPEDEMAGEQAASRCRSPGNPLLAIGITGNQPQGDPLKDRMMETLAALARERAVTLVFLGAAGDRGEIEERMRRFKLEGTVLCGDLRLRECVAFLRHASAAFVVDSGLRHMANAAGIPVIYFRNLYTFKGETGNYLPTEHDLAPDVECLSRELLAARPPLFEVGEGLRVLSQALA